MISDHIPVSVQVLYEGGPLSLRDLTTATAVAMACNQRYENVDAVMRRQRDLGRVTVDTSPSDDWREWVWSAVPTAIPDHGT